MKYLSSPFWDDNDGKTGLGLPMGVGYLCAWGGLTNSGVCSMHCSPDIFCSVTVDNSSE